MQFDTFAETSFTMLFCNSFDAEIDKKEVTAAVEADTKASLKVASDAIAITKVSPKLTNAAAPFPIPEKLKAPFTAPETNALTIEASVFPFPIM